MIPGPFGVEWELGPDGKRTGRWRRRQYVAGPKCKRVPSKRMRCEWNDGPVSLRRTK